MGVDVQERGLGLKDKELTKENSAKRVIVIGKERLCQSPETPNTASSAGVGTASHVVQESGHRLGDKGLHASCQECVHAKPLSCIRLFATLWTVAPPGSSVHGILQARILEWVAVPSSRGSSQPRDRNSYLLRLLRWQAGSLSPGQPVIPRGGNPDGSWVLQDSRRRLPLYYTPNKRFSQLRKVSPAA